VVRIIADVGCNYIGDIEIGKRLIDEIHDTGCDLIKFQWWVADELYDKSHPYWDVIKKSEMSYEMAEELMAHADKIGTEVFFSVFSPDIVDLTEMLGVKRYKIAARSAFDKELVKKVTNTGKPVTISLSNQCPSLYRCSHPSYKTKLLYCISSYPTTLKEINLGHFANLYFDGFSDHTTGITASIVAVSIAQYHGNKDFTIEKHVMSNAGTRSPDVCCSITISQLNRLVKHIRELEKMI